MRLRLPTISPVTVFVLLDLLMVLLGGWLIVTGVGMLFGVPVALIVGGAMLALAGAWSGARRPRPPLPTPPGSRPPGV
jgi:hypothetical protein